MSIPEKNALLLVEDDFLTALAERKGLEERGYRVLTASSGEEAMERCEADPSLDLILMDVDLGEGIDGPGAARAILKRREIPIIFLSAHSEREVVERTEAITSYGYIVKSAGIAVVDASIKTAIKLYEARKSLWIEKELLRTTLDSIGDAVMATDASGKVTRMNPVAERLTGWPIGQAEGRPIGEIFRIVNAHTREPVEDPVKRVLELGAIVGLANHTVLISRYGSEHQIADSAAPIRDGNGGASGVILVFRDVTRDYAVLEALKKSEKLYRSLFENMLNGVAYCRMQYDEGGRPVDFTYLSVNAAFEAQTGLKSVEGRRVTEVIPGIRESDEPLFEVYGRVARLGKPECIEYFVEALRMWFEVSVYSPQREYFIAVFDVITERKNADLRLRASEERLRLALGAARAGTWEWDLRTGENVWSDELWQLYGLSRDSVSPSYEAWLATVAPSDRERIVAALDVAVGAGTEIEVEWRVRGSGGEGRWLMSRGRPEFDGSGRALRYLGAVIDISDRKRTEEKVGELLDEKELILKEVHHRVKNNLNTVYSFLALQAGSTGEPLARRVLTDAGSRVQSMLLLYDRLYQSGSFVSMRVDLYLSPLIDQIMEVFPNRDSVRVLKRIEAFPLDADRLQPLGVIVNELLTNIMKYAFVGKGGGEIIVEASSVGGLVALAIQDDGDGLPESIDFRHSSGFGLMLVEALTKQLKGSVRIDRRRGTGIVLEFWK